MPGSPEISRDSAVLIERKEKVLTAILRIGRSKLFLCNFIKGKGDGRLEALILRGLLNNHPSYNGILKL